MKLAKVIVVLTTVTLLGFAVEGDSWQSLELLDNTHGLTEPQYSPVDRDTVEVIIGTQVTGNYIPFWGSSYNACRFQALYLQSEINQAGQIVTFSFMPASATIGTFNNMRVYLCHTSATQLGTTFDLNYGGNTPVLVIDEPSMVIGNAGNLWMDWDVSFDYNNVDNLLIEIRWNGDNGNGVTIWRTGEAVPRRLYAWDDNATTGTTGTQCYYTKLAISTGPPPDHDAGVVSIDAPGLNIMPNTTLDPTATYRNFGTAQETFDVYYLIDSLGVNIYNGTANITLDATTDTTISFASWTCGNVTGTTYDITAYTVLSGDINPANDTLTQQTVVNPTYWEILTDIPTAVSGHSEATAHDGYYYVFSGGSGNNEVQIYDIANGTWSSGTSNPSGMAQYGTANYVVDKYYRIGGWNGSSALNTVDVYDPVSTSWTTGASAPTLLIDHITGVYRDSLLYCFGGGNWFSGVTPNTNVYFYDVYSASWTTATSFPGSGRGCLAGGVIDSFAIVACGFDGVAMRIDYVVGVIDPANPSTITWGSPTNIPAIDSLYRMPSGVDPFNQELWITCGQKWTVQINRTFSYSVYTDTWTEWMVPKYQVVANVTPMAITTTTEGDLGLYVAGGYYNSAAVTDHEVFHTGKTTGVKEQPKQETGSFTFGFAPNMPNPVSGYTAIQYTTTRSGATQIRVYDGLGRLVRTLVDRSIEPAGTKTVYWNGKDDAHRSAANGIYFVRLEAEGKTAIHKMIIVK
ncbi:T9SS type A sorting domain-containing protein [candidate division WOR-3 bacterium]|nr:T9SS type A sorting domain-containing protein [candidate division WOR-3 bacterium]